MGVADTVSEQLWNAFNNVSASHYSEVQTVSGTMVVPALTVTYTEHELYNHEVTSRPLHVLYTDTDQSRCRASERQ